MAKPNAVKKPVEIFVSTENTNHRDIAQTNYSLQNILRKKPKAEVIFYGLPTAANDLFYRRITVVKVNKKDVLFDTPDIEDVYDTDLPWVGYATFNSASRQFRSKVALGVVVDIVRQYDGYLYTLSEQLLDARRENVFDPVIVSQWDKGVVNNYQKLTIRSGLSKDEILEQFGDASIIPPSLITELTSIGYRYENGLFVHQNEKGVMSKLVCRLYGKIMNT